METVQIVRIKDVIIEKISANDEELGHIFGYSKRQACERRREMNKLPSQQKYLRDGGSLVTIKGLMPICNIEVVKHGRKKLLKPKKLETEHKHERNKTERKTKARTDRGPMSKLIRLLNKNQ